MSWIVVRNWKGPKGFQHYKDRQPTWIKCYTELLHDPEYMKLTLYRRGLLHGLWLEYALSRTCLELDLKLINRSLNSEAKMADIQSLVDAGFITIVASKPRARRYQSAMPEKEKEKERTSAHAREGKNNSHPQEPSPYADHSKQPRIKAAEDWVANGLLLEVPIELRHWTLMDEFNISRADAERLVESI